MYQAERLKRWLPVIVFVCFSCAYLYELTDVLKRYDRSEKVINEDALGYYAILPAYFKYNDPNWQFLDTVTAKQEKYANYIPPIVKQIDSSKNVCKYYSGPALLQLPFYFMAELSSNNKDPFDQSHHFYILLSVIFYVVLGFLLLYRQLLQWQYTPVQAGAFISFVLFGTNLFVYTTYDPAYSHAYSFFAFSAFASLLFSIKRQASLIKFIATGLVFGLILAIRPLNGIVILLAPIILYGQIIHIIKNHYQYILAALVAAMLFPAIQSYLWHWQTGHWYVYPYGEEKLNLLQPQLFEFIFGYNCGWALYTPGGLLMVVIGLTGLVIKKQYARALLSLLGITGILYLMSCWYYLHYGCTAGCRPITDYYGLLLLLMAYGFRDLTQNPWIRYSLLSLIASCFIYWRIIQYQFMNNIINWCDMDKARFEMVFLKTHDVYHYSTYPFWDFSDSNNNPVISETSINKTLHINEKVKPYYILLPETDCKDSSLLLSFFIRADTSNKDAYLRLLITDNGQYVEQQTLLLQRKATANGKFKFQFLIRQSLRKGRAELRLESTGSLKSCSLHIEKLTIQRR
jgi:hypothetical protein